jgi:hypothetical protein
MRIYSESDIVTLVLNYLTIEPIYNEKLVRISVRTITPKVAQLLAEVVSRSVIDAATELDKSEISLTVQRLSAQKDSLRKRLVEEQENLKIFYTENPVFANEQFRSQAVREESTLRQEYSRRQEELKTNIRVLEFYKKRYGNFFSNSDSTTEVYDKFKQELIELKYKKKKYLFEGYTETDEGIKDLDEKISHIEKILSTSGSMANKRVVSVDNESRLSQKIVELQDTIKKEEIEIASLAQQVQNVEERSKVRPQLEMLNDDFQREVKLARELFEDVSRRLEQALIRQTSYTCDLTVVITASVATAVLTIGLLKSLIFSFLVGIVLCFAIAILSSLIRRMVIDDQSVEDMGLKFAGELGVGNSARAEILSNLGCLYRDQSDKPPPIVLCTSIKESAGIKQVLSLTNYLAMQKEKTLFIIVGRMDLHDNFKIKSDLGYAKVYCSLDGKQFVLQLADEESMDSIHECLQILEAQFKVRYSMVLLYIQDGIDCLAYPMGQHLANKMLVIGTAGKNRAGDYFKLIQGFKNLDEVYIALDRTKEPRKQKSKDSWRTA